MARLSTLVASTLALAVSALPTEPKYPYCGKVAPPSYMVSVQKYPNPHAYGEPSNHWYVAKEMVGGGAKTYKAGHGKTHTADYEYPETTETYKTGDYKSYTDSEYPETTETYKTGDYETYTAESEYPEATETYKVDDGKPHPADYEYPEAKNYRRSNPAKYDYEEYAQLVTFDGPLGHYGCQLSVTLPEEYAPGIPMNVYRVHYPVDETKTAYADLEKYPGIYGTVAARPGKQVINTSACPTAEGEGLAFLFEVPDWVKEGEVGWENYISGEEWWKSVGAYMSYDC